MPARNYINAQISCEGVFVEISSTDLTFDELEIKFFSILDRLPVNTENKFVEVNIR